MDDIEEIKRIVSLSNGKIKESWVNTLSFLATLDTGDSLRDWLYICDPEMIVKLEKSRIPETVRDDVVIRILSDLEKRNLWLNYGKNNAYELARFGQSSGTLTFLLSRINPGLDECSVSNAICVLSEFSKLFGQKDRVTTVLFSFIQNKEISDMRWQPSRSAYQLYV